MKWPYRRLSDYYVYDLFYSAIKLCVLHTAV